MQVFVAYNTGTTADHIIYGGKIKSALDGYPTFKAYVTATAGVCAPSAFYIWLTKTDTNHWYYDYICPGDGSAGTSGTGFIKSAY